MFKMLLVVSCVVVVCTGNLAQAVLPIRKPDVEAVVEKVVLTTEADNKNGVATVFLKDRKVGVSMTNDTAIHRQLGKLVPLATIDDIHVGAKVSVWIDAKTGRAVGILIFS